MAMCSPEQLVELVKAASASKTNELEICVAHTIERMFNPPYIAVDDLRDGLCGIEPGGITFVTEEEYDDIKGCEPQTQGEK